MKKSALIEALKEAARTEESATTLYSKHLDAFCTRFAVDMDYIKMIKKYVTILINGNKKHKRICEETIREVEKEKRDDY